MQTVVVTGVSSGIGFATVRALIDRQFHVCGTVRRQQDGDKLRHEFGDSFTPLILDVTKSQEIEEAVHIVRGKLGDTYLRGLVNNAGISVQGPNIFQPMDVVREQFEVNLFGPMQMVQAFAGLLGADAGSLGPKGRIVNVTSIAGRIGPPFLGAYSATKHAFEGYSDSLRRELMLYGIDVIVISPGYVKTAISDKTEAMAGPYDDTAYRDSLGAFEKELVAQIRNGHEPEAVGKAIARALTISKPRAHYPVAKNRLLEWTIPLALSKRVMDKMVAKQFGLTPSAVKI